MTCQTWFYLIVVMVVGLFAASCSDDRDDGVEDTLTILYWQAPTIANPYLAGGTKDFDAATLVLEPLANYDENGELTPRLAGAIPTLENGGISADLTTITWKLKAGVLWSDGTPLTAEDAVFTYRYVCALPEATCDEEADRIKSIEALDDSTLEITYPTPKPWPYTWFVGAGAVILQKAQFEHCVGEAARQCQAESSYPIGTGPYKIVEFNVNKLMGTSVVVYESNENFRVPNQPFFSDVTIKGGGDAVTAARAVLETGEADYAWNLQVEPQLLQALQAGGKGMVATPFSARVERLVVNFTNPDPGLGDKRSEWLPDDPNPHPFLSDPAVRQALSLAIDRGQIAEHLYGLTGRPTCNVIPAPPRYVSPHNEDCLSQDIEEANALLDAAGWLPGADGVRQKDGVRLSIVYRTSTNSVRQETQALVQQWWREIGAETELQDIPADDFFGNDPDNPDTTGRFYTDIAMYTQGAGVDPQGSLGNWRTSEIARAENDWNGGNVSRWYSEAYDVVYEELAQTPIGPQREALVIELNDLLVQNYVLIPLVNRASASAFSNSLKGVRVNPWDSELWNIHEWYRE